MNRATAWACGGLALLLAGCVAAPPTAAPGRYVVGEGYQLGGVWSYPREDFALVQTGLASVATDRSAGRRTTNGEVHDPALLTAAHRTLQLPAIVQVTNLENGLQLEVRVNDRGPARPGRVLELSGRAASLLGIQPDGAAQIRLAVQSAPSRALAESLPQPETARLAIAAAPLAGVAREDLDPPPGAVRASRVREARPLPGQLLAPGPVNPGSAATPPTRLPENLTRVAPQPGQLHVQAASFGRRDLAQRQAARLARLGARVEQVGGSGRGAGAPSFRVRIGPLQNVGAADRALEETLRLGVSEARILVD